MKKTIEVYKHPYMWRVQVEFGTIEEMLLNCYRKQSWNGLQVFVGGSFNEKMNQTSRASLVEIGVEIDYDSFDITTDGKLILYGIKAAKGIRYSCWEGTYVYCASLFDDGMMKEGIYPVRADWDGRTYIERGHYGEDGKWVTHYELTDTYRY